MKYCTSIRFMLIPVVLAAFALMFFVASPKAAVPVSGEVTGVDGTNVEIRLKSKGAVRTGDRVELSYVTSTGMELPVGTWRVKTVKGATLIAEMSESPTQPVVGLKAKIYPGGKEPAKQSPRQPSATAVPGKGKSLPPAAIPAVTQKGWLGVMLTGKKQEEDSPGILNRLKQVLDENAGGIEVAAVVAGSPAEKAGMLAGDVIVQLNGTPVSGGQEFVRSIQGTTPGSIVNIKVLRNNAGMNITARIEPLIE